MPLVNVSDLTKPQRSVVESVPRGVKYVEGPAGTGKTTIGVRRMLRLLTKDKVFANEILVLVPQRALALPYVAGEEASRLDAGGRITYTTIGGLSREVVDLFYPLVADEAGFSGVGSRPAFLTLETAQYHMARVVGPLLNEQAYFDTITIARNRLYSQIIDNLNKAAVVGFPHTQVGERLIAAWGDKDPAQVTVYQQMQECAGLFRAYCLKHNLVDFSLQMELFRWLWQMPAVRSYLTTKYRHLIFDNIEEDTPVTHDIVLDWLDEAESALLIRDTEAGFRRFLGASPESANRLSGVVTTDRDKFTFGPADSFVTRPATRALGAALAVSLEQTPPEMEVEADPREAITFDQPRFHTHMLQLAAERIGRLVHKEGVPPGEVVVLAPFLSDSLRFTLMEALDAEQVPYRSHRPSRALREEPAAQALLTWAQLAHPTWQMAPAAFEVTNALTVSIEGLDLVRAQLITNVLYRKGRLESFDKLASGVQARITFAFGEKVEALHRWLAGYAAEPVDEIDLFWSRLFGEVLTKPGFGYQQQAERARVTANLIQSARKFRQVMGEMDVGRTLGQEYVQMVREGVIADQYIRDWAEDTDEETVLLAPAYTFLMMNRPVTYQFWLNVGSSGWWERLYQPLTHPYVLTRYWNGGVWTDEDEYYTQNAAMYRLVLGLVRRCRVGVYLGFSELGEQGYEQRGKLLGAVQDMLRRLNRNEEGAA